MDLLSLEQAREAMDELNFEESEDQLIIALDFGTTFSGIAYAFTNAEKPDLVSITDWPGTSGALKSAARGRQAEEQLLRCGRS
jgi:hypothetical protein